MFSKFIFFFFKQKTAYEMRMRDRSSDVCSSDLKPTQRNQGGPKAEEGRPDETERLQPFGQRAAEQSHEEMTGGDTGACSACLTPALQARGDRDSFLPASRRSSCRPA